MPAAGSVSLSCIVLQERSSLHAVSAMLVLPCCADCAGAQPARCTTRLLPHPT